MYKLNRCVLIVWGRYKHLANKVSQILAVSNTGALVGGDNQNKSDIK